MHSIIISSTKVTIVFGLNRHFTRTFHFNAW